MLELLRNASADLAMFLGEHLPTFSDDWWQGHVIKRLTYQQQRMTEERGITSLEQLDLAALLRILDENWYELSQAMQWPRDGRNWVKETQTVRNKWAHMSSDDVPAEEIYRDADTLDRLMTLIKARAKTIADVNAAKRQALTEMTAKDEGTNISTAILSNTPGAQINSRFSLGEIVALRSSPDKQIVVVTVISGKGEYRYGVFDNGATLTYYESQLQAVPKDGSDKPQLSADGLRALLTCIQILSPSAENLFSMRSGRVQFVPYQYRPVLKLIRSDRPRILIADEVGVGKTIEAGLIIKELQARMDISSVLVICPKALVSERKWQNEMKRFDENFTPLDGPLLRHCLKETALDGEWPYQYGKALLPFSLFDSDLLLGEGDPGRNRDQGLLTLDPPPKFDLVIVDEAHHIRNPDTNLYHGIRHFCDNAQAVVLMTATPVQLGSHDLYTLLNVVRPDLIIDPASFQQMAEPNTHINEAVRHCRSAGPDWPKQARDSLEDVARTEWGRVFIRETPEFQDIYDRLGKPELSDTQRVRVIREIEQLYTFSPMINRTRRRDIGEFTVRKPETLTVEFTPSQRTLHDNLLNVVARILSYSHGQQNVAFMMTTIRRQAASCLYGLAPLLSDILQRKLDALELLESTDVDSDVDLRFVDQIRPDIEAVLAQTRSLESYDPKAEAFLKLLGDKATRENNKALVFSTFRHTLNYLKLRLSRTNLRVGVVHGDVSDYERSDLRRRFALPKTDGEALDVLLSSEVGCEGLDFQFCDFLVNYDLPWNPMRIEQRIGRIDRYGQKSESVAIANLITPGTVDADIYSRCLWRIGVFHHAVGASEEILGRVTQELHAIADSFNLTPQERAEKLQQLADNGIRQIQEEQELENREAELFGLDVSRHGWKSEIEAAESSWLSPGAIHTCIRVYLATRLGRDIDHLLGEKPLKTLRISKDARSELLDDFKRLPRSIDPTARQWEKWLKGSDPSIAVTFDQQAAAANPNALHITATHSLVRQAAQFLENTAPRHASFALKTDELPPGRHPFAIYRWMMQGVKTDCKLISVATNAAIEEALLDALQETDDQVTGKLPTSDERQALDARHYELWLAAQGGHLADNEQVVNHRIQSLTISHRARCLAIQDQVARATNDKIRVMKQSELARAQADFERRMKELERDAASGDVRFDQVVLGTLTVEALEQS